MNFTIQFNRCFTDNPANICLFKVNNRNTRKRWVICSMLTTKTPEQRHVSWGVFWVILWLISRETQIKFFHSILDEFETIPVGIYLLKVNNINTRTRWEICLKLTIKTTEQHPYTETSQLYEGVVLVSLLLTLLTYFTPCSSVSIVHFKHVTAGWEGTFLENLSNIYQTESLFTGDGPNQKRI